LLIDAVHAAIGGREHRELTGVSLDRSGKRWPRSLA
jgi:hypothetical protein